MVRRLGSGFGELLDDGGRRRNIRVAEAEVDDVATLAPQPPLQLVDGREDVRGQVADAAELHRGPRLHPRPEEACPCRVVLVSRPARAR
jgi:hypothetical protein